MQGNLRIRVRPRASFARVGGAVGDRLIVAVVSPALEGRATKEAQESLAKALGVRAHQLQLIQGELHRDKDFAFISDDEEAISDVFSRYMQLKGQ